MGNQKLYIARLTIHQNLSKIKKKTLVKNTKNNNKKLDTNEKFLILAYRIYEMSVDDLLKNTDLVKFLLIMIEFHKINIKLESFLLSLKFYHIH